MDQEFMNSKAVGMYIETNQVKMTPNNEPLGNKMSVINKTGLYQY